jgi:hypothetical protein
VWTILRKLLRFLKDPILKKTKSARMNKPYPNDQAHIAEEFHLFDDYTNQTARLAFFKINSYKLSLIKSSYSTSLQELSEIIKGTLLNYTAPSSVLANSGFFNREMEN